MNEQELQQQIIQLVQAAMGGNQQANKQIQQIMYAAQQGDQQATQLAQMIQSVAQQLQQQQVQAAKFGAKLDYIKQLRGQCPDGYEMQYYKAGGQLCKKCMKKQAMQEGGDFPQDPIDQFKCGRKMKKKKCENGGFIPFNKCGKKMKKKQKGGTVDKKKKYPLVETDKNGKNKTVYYNDEATRDSIAANKYADQEVQEVRPGKIKNGKWIPDRTKAPYNRKNK